MDCSARSVRLLVFPVFLLPTCFAPLVATAEPERAPCFVDTAALDPGERRMALICGADISAGSQLKGFEETGIEILYRQDLRRCSGEDSRPGVLLELLATPDAQSTAFGIVDQKTGAEACAGIIAVPARRLVRAEPLSETEESGAHDLRVRSKELDLSAACAAGIQFPPGRGPRIEAVDEPACSRDLIEMRVRVTEGSQHPAKLLLIARDTDGEQVAAVAHVQPPTPYFLNAMDEDAARFVSVNGVRTRYFEKGDGEVLLLVHGGQPSAADYNAWEWQQNFDGLAENFRVIAVDRIGQGYTDNPPDLDDYKNYYPLVVDHLLGFMNALGIEQAHLVGHSQGGYPVTRIALDYPERVASLVIVDSTMIAPAGNAAQAARFYLHQQNDLHPAEGESIQSIRRGMELASYTKNNITDQRVERIFKLSRTRKYEQAKAWFMKSYMSPAHPDFRKLKAEIWSELEAGRLTVPMLIIWGRQDPEGSFSAGEAMALALQNVGSTVVFQPFEDTGHLAYMEHPQAFNRVVTEFAAGH